VTEFVDSYTIPKLSYLIESDINRIVRNQVDAIGLRQSKSTNNYVFYRAAGGGYFLLIKNKKSITYINGMLEDVKAEKKIGLFSEIDNSSIGALLSSSLFYWNYIAYTDCRNLQKSFIDAFKYPTSIVTDKKLIAEGQKLFKDYEKKKYTKSTHYKSTGNDVIYDEYYPKKSKSIIDEIDKVLAKHYGFTEEELDYIINYDIKYRMGDELNDNN
jgi:predicted Zn-dependent peptidase